MKRLIVLTVPHFFSGEGYVITRLFEEGMEHLHIRKPGCEANEIIGLVDDIPSTYHKRIVLHDCFDLTADYAIGGIHLNSRNLHIPTGFKGSISRSCHTLLEVQESKRFDYVFLSPIFDSISKQGYGSGFSMELLEYASSKGIINERVIALGGMNATTIPQIGRLNFGGAAVLGALWGNDPSENELNLIIEQYKQLLR